MSTWTGAVSTDWNNAANWTIGGTGIGVPSATVDAIFSGTPTNPCVLGANRTCRVLTFTGYTSTVDFATFTLTAKNNITYQANQSSRIIGTTGILISGATGTITSNGGTWPLNYRINNFIGTVTLADNMIVSGSFSTGGGGTVTVNNNTLSIGGNFTGGTAIVGTTNFIMNGTGTLTTGNSNIELNTSGTITISGNIQIFSRFIITSVGTLTGLSTSNITFRGDLATNTINLGGRTIGNLTLLANAFPITFQFLSSLTCNNFTVANGTGSYSGPTSPSTAVITVNGNYIFNGSQLLGNGTLSVLMTGASGTAAISISGPTINIPLTINAGANTVSFPAAANMNVGPTTLTLSSGNINANGGTVTMNGTTLNTPNVNYFNITASNTITINSNFNVTNNLVLSGSTTFAGTAGWTCASLIMTAAGALTITLRNGVTYTTTTAVQLTGATNTNRYTMISDNASFRAIWTVGNTATQAITYVDGTRIDSSGGATVWTLGTVSLTAPATLNWNNGSQPSTVGYTFVN